jgi:hypothetical protein
MNDVPVTGQIMDTIAKGLRWLERQIEAIVGSIPQPAPTAAPPDLTDV